jgi:hypothetical protein
MNKIAVLIFLFSGVQIYAQPLVNSENMWQKVFYSDFSDADKALWSEKTTPVFNYSIASNKYSIACSDDAKRGYIPLKWNNTYPDFMIETDFTLAKEMGSSGVFGIAYGIEGKLELGYVLEFRKDMKFRINFTDHTSTTRPITGQPKDQGWVGCKDLNKTGKPNKVQVKIKDNNVAIVVNGKQIFTYRNHITLGNDMGFEIGGISKVEITDFAVYAKPDSTNKQPALAEVKNNTASASASDVSVAASIQKKSEPMQAQTSNTGMESSGDLQMVKAQLALALKKQAELEHYISENLDMKLKAENDANLAKIAKLEKENEELKAQVKSTEK